MVTLNLNNLNLNNLNEYIPHSIQRLSANGSGVWAYRQMGQDVSPHFTRQLEWKVWLHNIVRIPSTLSSILSRQTGHDGNSVCPLKGIPLSPTSTLDTNTMWQTTSGSREL